jgi:hypothetical protein
VSFISTIYGENEELLSAVGKSLAGQAEAIEEPAEVEAPATLNLDPATIAQNAWQVLVVFGSIKASLEAVQLVVKLLRDRATNGQPCKIALTGPSGAKIELDGRMTPEQLAATVKRYETALASTKKGTE